MCKKNKIDKNKIIDDYMAKHPEIKTMKLKPDCKELLEAQKELKISQADILLRAKYGAYVK